MKLLPQITTGLCLFLSLACEKKLDVAVQVPAGAIPQSEPSSEKPVAEASTSPSSNTSADQVPVPMPSPQADSQPSPQPNPPMNPKPSDDSTPMPDSRLIKIKAVNLLAGDGCVMSAGAADNTAKKEECWADLTILDKTFRFYFFTPSSPSVDHIGFSQNCTGLNFPAMSWPENCFISFDGPTINVGPYVLSQDQFGRFVCDSKGCPQSVIELRQVTITPSTDGCFGSSSPATSACYAILKVDGVDKRFSFFVPSSSDSDSMGFSSGCADTNFPTKSLATGCRVSFDGPSLAQKCPTQSNMSARVSCANDGCRCESQSF